MRNIRRLCTFALCAVVPLMIYGFYSGMSWALNEALLQPERWMRDTWVDPNAVIAPLTRWFFFGMWSLSPITGLFAYCMAIMVLWRARSGILFDTLVLRGVTYCGVGLSLSALTKIAAACVSPMVKSWHNPQGPLPLRLWLNSEDYALLLSGLGFVLLGLVMREAKKIVDENEDFV